MLDLLRPFAFLSIRHASGIPFRVNWLGPALLTGLTFAIFWATDIPINFFGPQGILDRLLAFIQTLAGFYIAALAAVSSFNSPHLDTPMPGKSTKMFIKYNGVLQPVDATRRRFITAMFAYLTAISILFTAGAIVSLVLAGPVSTTYPNLVPWLRPIGMLCFMFFGIQMAAITFWGLFYLGERLLTPD